MVATITITIKCSNAEKAEVETESSATVAEFKSLVAAKLSIPAENQRLIYKGRILKDESTLEQYDIEGWELNLINCKYDLMRRWAYCTSCEEWDTKICCG
jgi:hypothetical protein